MAETKAIYGALAAILKAMSVEKGGTLPSNMGGKPYITAVDLNSEAKRQFVENNIVMIPSERIVKHEAVINANRIAVLIAVEGSYELVSTEDGSSVTISGSGDGLAQGSAVASNIASTNALKNALLRTFLVTEQSVEDAGKAGVPDESAPKQSPAARKIDAAKAPTNGASDAAKVTAEIRAKFVDTGILTVDELNSMASAIASEMGKASGSFEVRSALLKKLNAGEAE